MPAELFFDMLKSNDLRLLLITSDYPDFIPVDLPPLREKLVLEYETISKDNSYSEHKEDINEAARDQNYINRLKSIYLLMIMGDENMINELEEIDIDIDNISPDSILRVANLIELEQTNLELYFLTHKEDNTDDKTKEENKFEFLEVLTRLSNFFKREIPRDIVVTQFLFLMDDVKRINKVKKDGRTTEF